MEHVKIIVIVTASIEIILQKSKCGLTFFCEAPLEMSKIQIK
jgi:hypothetical protein